jgi:hypothetical protein
MSEIIDSKKFDEIFDKIVYPEKLIIDNYYMREVDRNEKIEKFLRENTYKVYYENQLFYVLTDSYFYNSE